MVANCRFGRKATDLPQSREPLNQPDAQEQDVNLFYGAMAIREEVNSVWQRVYVARLCEHQSP